MTKVSETERRLAAKTLYVGPCVVVYDVSVDQHEQLYEVTAWPHHELVEEDDCSYLQLALDAIGAWASFAVPLEAFEDMSTGAITYLLCPLT